MTTATSASDTDAAIRQAMVDRYIKTRGRAITEAGKWLLARARPLHTTSLADVENISRFLRNDAIPEWEKTTFLRMALAEEYARGLAEGASKKEMSQ